MFPRAFCRSHARLGPLGRRLGASNSRRHGSTLVIAEHDNATLSDSLRPVLSAAKQLGEVTVLVAGKGCAPVADAVSSIDGVSRVLVADDALYADGVAENLAPLVQKLQGDSSFSHLVVAHNVFGKNLLPRVAGMLEVSQVSDVISIESEMRFQRPMYAGNAVCTVESDEAVKLLTIRTTAFPPAEDAASKAEVTSVDKVDVDQVSRVVANETSSSSGPSLTSASKVVSGGRGMGDGANFKILEELAEELGDAAVGASRAAVDAGFVSNDYQVGQTGKVVAPDLYVACGISGAIQHLAGMKDSKTIVAINKDPEAPIFQVADYGLVADLFEAVPEMTQKLK